ATPAFYAGQKSIPARGPQAALTVAGTIGGWQKALEVSSRWGGSMPLSRLLQSAIGHAHNGVVVTASQSQLTREKLPGLKDAPGFAETFLTKGAAPEPGAVLKYPALGHTLKQLAECGLDDFYRGELAQRMGAELERVGSPLRT